MRLWATFIWATLHQIEKLNPIANAENRKRPGTPINKRVAHIVMLFFCDLGRRFVHLLLFIIIAVFRRSAMKKLIISLFVLTTSAFTTTINVPTDYSTIQAGINAASSGDTVSVAAGTYVENIIWPNTANIKLISNSGPESTIIDGDSSGSVVLLENGETPEINGFTIRNGFAYEGGGINSASVVPKLKNLIIANNQSQSHAGGILLSLGEAELTNLIIKNNTAGGNGGGIYLSGSTNTSQLSNVLVDNNTANGWGGGIYVFGFSEIDLNYITISDNLSNSGGGGLFMYFGAEVNLSNSILWNNSPEEIHLYYANDPSSINISYSIVKGGETDIQNTNILGSVIWGNGNSDDDPIFIDASNGDYHLSNYSPAIGAGTTTDAPNEDIEGNPRPNPSGTNPDIGAYENSYGVPQYQPQVLNVPTDYSTIQAALTAANATDTVLVQPGTYTENIIWPETNGIKLISAGDSSNTIIDGGGTSRVIYMYPIIATIDNNTLIQGFKITNGGGVNYGGGIYLKHAYGGYTSPKITNSQIVNNEATSQGGGVYLSYSTPSFINVKISANTASEGGGVRSDGNADTEFLNVVISENHAQGSGGGLYQQGHTTTLTNVEILNNTANEGGGVYFENVWDGNNQLPATFTNVKIIGNKSSNGGGGIVLRGSTNLSCSKTYIANNQSLQYNGGGILMVSGYGEISGITVSNNTALSGGGIYGGGGGFNFNTITISNNKVTTLDGINGIYIGSASNINPSVTNSNIVNGGYGLNNSYTNFIMSATNNYWGDSSGPYHPSQNPTGQGDSVNAYVNVDPWLTAPNTDAPPIPAQNTTVTGTGNDFISLKWDASPLGDLAGYKLYYDSDSSGYPYTNSVDVGTDTSYTLSSLSLGTTYYLAVTTYDTDGNESWYSNEVSGVTRIMQAQSLDIGGDEDLQHMVNHTPSITFGYYDSMNETQTSYQVQVSSDSLYSSADMWDSGTITSSDTSVTYAGTTLEDGVTYYVRVKVGAGTFYSNWSTLTFRMNTEPTTPVLVSPINDQVSGTPVVLRVLNATDTESDVITYSFNVYSDIALTTKLDSATAVTEGTDTTSWQVTATLPDNGQYFWTVSTNDGYEESNVSTAASFLLNVSNDAPASFSTIYPVDSSEVSSTLPTLLWNISSDPDPLDTVRYMIQFGSSIPDLETFYTDTIVSYQLTTNLNDNTDYFWRVIAEDLNGASTENTGGYHTFRVNTENDLPGDFALISPEDESIVTDVTPTLYWEVPIDPDDRSRSIVSYYVYLDTNLTDLVPDTVSTNSYTASNLIEDAMYYWKIVAVDDDGGTNESSTWSFWMNGENSPPLAFSLVEPLNNAVLNIFNPPFCWEESADPDINDQISYTVLLGEHIDSVTIIYNGPYMESCFSETMGLVEDNTIYYWKVIAMDSSGATTENDSGYYSFIINTANDPPSAATLVAPLNGSIQTDLTPNFYWTEAFDPDPLDHVSYTMNWWPLGVLPYINSINTDSTGATSDEDIPDNAQFGWMVVANDMHDSLSLSSSDTSYFYSDAFPEPPLNFATVSPEDNVEGLATEVEFIWEETDDPDPIEEISYRVVYASDWEDSSTYVYSETIEDTLMGITLADNSQYYWLVEAMDSDGFIVGSNDNTPNTIVVGTLSIAEDLIPVEFAIHQNYPNPFNPVTTLRYDLPEQTYVNIIIYDMLGRKIRTLINEQQDPGYKSLIWNATNDYGKPVSAGIYLYQIQAREYISTKKMDLLK